MEFRIGSKITTKNGECILKKMDTLYNALNLGEVTVFTVEANGKERRILENEIVKVRNSHLNIIEEP